MEFSEVETSLPFGIAKKASFTNMHRFSAIESIDRLKEDIDPINI